MPLRTRDLVMQEFDVWGKKQVQKLVLWDAISFRCTNYYTSRGVEAHWDHPYNRPWATVDEVVKEMMAELVGMYGAFFLHIKVQAFLMIPELSPNRCTANWGYYHEHPHWKYSCLTFCFLSSNRRENQDHHWEESFSFWSCEWAMDAQIRCLQMKAEYRINFFPRSMLLPRRSSCMTLTPKAALSPLLLAKAKTLLELKTF